MRKPRDRLGIILTILFAAMGVVSVLGRGCMLEDQEVSVALNDNGFKLVQVVDRSDWFVDFGPCGVGDATMWKVRAKVALGKPSNMVVCVGWPLKTATVRTR